MTLDPECTEMVFENQTFMPILETNEDPVRVITISDDWSKSQSSAGCWYPDKDIDNKCTIIDTPNSHIANTYSLLRDTRVMLLEMMTMGDIKGAERVKKIIFELKEVINVYEKYMKPHA